MSGAVGQEKLPAGSGVSAYFKPHTGYALRRTKKGIADTRSLGRMLIGHFIGIIDQFLQSAGADPLITDIYRTVELWKFHIDPVRCVLIFEERAVLGHPGIHRILESVRIAALIKFTVAVLREINTEIPIRFKRVRRVAGYQHNGQQKTPNVYSLHSSIFRGPFEPLVNLQPDPEDAVVAGFLNGKDKISHPYYSIR